jgi:hypothetical protein
VICGLVVGPHELLALPMWDTFLSSSFDKRLDNLKYISRGNKKQVPGEELEEEGEGKGKENRKGREVWEGGRQKKKKEQNNPCLYCQPLIVVLF